MRALLALAVLSALVLAGGIALVYVPAGVIALGVQGLVAAYGGAYLRARSKEVQRR